MRLRGFVAKPESRSTSALSRDVRRGWRTDEQVQANAEENQPDQEDNQVARATPSVLVVRGWTRTSECRINLPPSVLSRWRSRSVASRRRLPTGDPSGACNAATGKDWSATWTGPRPGCSRDPVHATRSSGAGRQAKGPGSELLLTRLFDKDDRHRFRGGLRARVRRRHVDRDRFPHSGLRRIDAQPGRLEVSTGRVFAGARAELRCLICFEPLFRELRLAATVQLDDAEGELAVSARPVAVSRLLVAPAQRIRFGHGPRST